MDVFTRINGTFGLDDLKRLTWPIAWSATVPVSEQLAEEAAIHALAAAAIEELEQAYTCRENDEAVLEITITNGEIDEIVEAGFEATPSK